MEWGQGVGYDREREGGGGEREKGYSYITMRHETWRECRQWDEITHYAMLFFEDDFVFTPRTSRSKERRT